MSAAGAEKPLRKSAATRERILEAARRCFSNKNYENVGLREVGAAAGADAALVNRYFGGKERLFTEVITGAFHVDEHLPESMDEIGEFLVRQVTDDTGEGDDAGFNPLRMLLLAAASPETAQLVSKQFHAEFVRPLARKLHGRNTEMRSALIAAHVIGLATVRHLLKSPSLQGREPRPIIAMVGAAIQACVDAPLREEEKR